MKYDRVMKIAATLAVLMTITACSMNEGTDTGTDNGNNEGDEISITIEKVENFEGMEITDWLDENTVIIAKENSQLGKMSLLEISNFYPRGIYIYHLDTNRFEELISQRDMFLGGAKLSSNKKHILYYEYSIGDTAYFLMSMDGIKQSSVKDGVIGIAMTANWDDDNHVVGVSYAGGAYISDIYRNITQIEGLQEELFTVEKFQDRIYYVTIQDNLHLYMLDLETQEKKDLTIDNIDRINISPDGKQILITKWDGQINKLQVSDADGNIISTIAEGTRISGAVWSPDQQMIAYQLESVINGVNNSGLYVYDIIANKSMEIVDDIGSGSLSISWGPSGEKIAISELKDSSFDSSIIHLKLK